MKIIYQVKLEGTPEQLHRVAQLVKSCLGRDGKERPTMQEVKEELLAVQIYLGLPYTTHQSASFRSADSDVPETSRSQFLS